MTGVLPDIRVPYMGINSDDDPIANDIPLDITNKWVTIVATPEGGHLGWFEKEGGIMKRWIRKPVLEWLKLTAEGIVLDHRRPRSIYRKDDWLVQDGRDDLGVTVIQQGTVVQGVEGEAGLFAGF